jgi:hypothetical protein
MMAWSTIVGLRVVDADEFISFDFWLLSILRANRDRRQYPQNCLTACLAAW